MLFTTKKCQNVRLGYSVDILIVGDRLLVEPCTDIVWIIDSWDTWTGFAHHGLDYAYENTPALAQYSYPVRKFK